jgi:5-methylcytosine-specific restriction endonuclease McrA
MIDNVSRVFRCDLPTKAKFVLVCLADQSNEYGICYPGITTLSRMTSMPERTLQRVLGYLKKNGWIETFWKPTDKIRYKSILHYRLKIDGLQDMPKPNYSNCPPALREEVIERFEQTCSYCHKTGNETLGPDGKSWEVDRIVPGSRGGGYEPYNITLSCKLCNLSKGAKLAPSTTSLGAILDKEGCQNRQEVVPEQTRSGATGGTQSGSDPLRTPYKTREVSKEVTLETEEDSPSKEREDPAAAYRIAKSIFRKYCRGALGNLGEKQREEWSSFIHTYGEVKGLGAFTVWARELGLEAKKFKYPIALFLKDPAEFIEAYEIESSPMPAEEEKEEDRMLTAKDIIRERERRG